MISRPRGKAAKTRLEVLPEHYPVCNLCLELVPCPARRRTSAETSKHQGHRRNQ